MLTRLEVHGFKNLLDFELDLGPFNCIAGPNGVGKSNVFDAIVHGVYVLLDIGDGEIDRRWVHSGDLGDHQEDC